MRKIIAGAILTILAGGVAHYLWRHRNDQDDQSEYDGNPLMDPTYHPSDDPPQELFEEPEEPEKLNTFGELTITLKPNVILGNLDEGYKHIRMYEGEYWYSIALRDAIIASVCDQFPKLKREAKTLGIKFVGLEETADMLVRATGNNDATANRMACVYDTQEMIKNTIVHYIDTVHQSVIRA